MRNRDHLSFFGGVFFALALAAPAHAQEGTDPIPVRVRYFEGTVTVQRAQAAETSAALVNLPLDAGDRLWTDEEGRVELTLGDGTTIWLDHLTTIDIVALPRAGAGDTIIRLWGGSLITERPGGYGQAAQVLRVDTADAAMVLRPQGSYRIDLDDEHRTWLSVYDGNATMGAGGLTEIIAAGETTYVEPGTAPAEVVDFSTAEKDSFSSWQLDRWVALADTQKHVRSRDYVPEEARPYAADLERHGSWVYYDDFSAYAWRPSVAAGWAPYRDGRWVYSYRGWTWVPYASWGWATVHYGRWHHTPSYGWMWFPGSVYSPGWVSWYAGSGYLGWSPIGYYNRPFLSVNLFFNGHYGYGNGYHGGRNYNYAVPRGGKAVAGLGYARDLNADHGWTFVNAEHFGTGKTELRATARNAVPRQATGNAVSFEGSLRSRKPSVLASVASSRGTLPSRGAPARARTAVPRDSSSKPGTPVRSGSTIRRGSPRGTAQSSSRSTGRDRVRRSSPRAGDRGKARPRSDSASLSRRPELPTRAEVTSTSTSGSDPRHPLSRTSTSRYAPQSSQYWPEPRAYRPDTSRYQPRSGNYRSTKSSTRTPQRGYQPAAMRYSAPRTSQSIRPGITPSIQERNGFRSRPRTPMTRSFSRSSFNAQRSFSTPRGISSRSSGVSGRSFSAPSRSRSSGRSATRRSGRR